LTPAEQDEVDVWLRPEEVTLFWSQQPADQRHALETARRLAAAHADDRELIRAGLLHDIGKSEVRISAFGRTLATLGDLAGLPLPDRYQRYRDHGTIGGRALAALGAEPLVVAFASRHPNGPPADVAGDRWQLLLDADDD
jgi:putative nucleotidyltransferase with HDIG domain